MIAAAMLLLQVGASPPSLEPALGEIARAQAAQRTRAHRVRFGRSGTENALTLLYVPPDTYRATEAPAEESVQAGRRMWRRDGTGWVESEAAPSTLYFRSPTPVDDWEASVLSARALGSRPVREAPSRVYEYVLGPRDERKTVTVFVAESTGLPIRYEQADKDGVEAWDIEYDDALRITLPDGTVAVPRAAPETAWNYPRVELPAGEGGMPLLVPEAVVPSVVIRGEGLVRIAGGGELLLFVDRAVPWPTVERALDAAREAGVETVHLAQRSPSGSLNYLRAQVRNRNTPVAPVPIVMKPVVRPRRPLSFDLNGGEATAREMSTRLPDVLQVRAGKEVDVVAGPGIPTSAVARLLALIHSVDGKPVLTTAATMALLPALPPPPPPPPPRR